MTVSELMQAMADAGAPMEAIIIAVRALEEKDAALEAKRAVERDRKRRQRAKVDGEAGTVTGQSRDTDGTVPADPFLDKENPQTPKEINPIPCVKTPREARFHRLPEDWVPTRPLPVKTQVKVDLWPPGAIDDELARFHRWAANAENKNGKGKKLDWDKAWVNWLERQHDEHYGKRIGHRPANDRSEPQNPMVRAVIAAERQRRAGEQPF